MKTETLQSLLRRDAELTNEVKSMDSDMHMLVYENYNKFIGATDTIRQMKDNVTSMEAEMAKLVAGL